MSTRLRCIATLSVVSLFLLAEGRALGFPGFARKYSPNTSVLTFMPCAGCHDPFPRLTPFGRRFKEYGFRVAGDEQSITEALKSFPVSLRTAVVRSGIGEGNGATRGIVKPIAAGSLGSTVSFWVEQPFIVDADRFDRLNVNHAWAGAYDLTRAVRPELLNVRGGRFELDLPFSPSKNHNRFPYDPYSLRGDDSGWSLSSTQQGVELSGRPFTWARYSVAMTDTLRRSQDTDFDVDLYTRFAVDFAGAHRVGGFVYDGRDDVRSTTGTTVFEHRKMGGDFDLRFYQQGINVYGLYLWGRDRGGAEVDSNGGFLQVEKHATDWLMLTSRYTHLRIDSERRDSLALGAQAWFFERLRLAFEYRFQRGAAPDNGSLIVDFIL